MRKVLIAGLAAVLIAPASARTQGIPPQEESPPPPEAVPGPSPGEAAQPGEEARQKAMPAAPPDDLRDAPRPPATPGGPLHPGDEILPPDAGKAKPAAEKPKLDEAAGGLAGGVAANIAGTALGGPIGGIAASMVGSSLGSATVRVGKRMLGIGKKHPEPPVQQAAAAPQAGADASTTAAQPDRPEPAEPPPS